MNRMDPIVKRLMENHRVDSIPAGWEEDPESENPGWHNPKYGVSAYWVEDEGEFLLFPDYSDSPIGNEPTWKDVENTAKNYSTRNKVNDLGGK